MIDLIYGMLTAAVLKSVLFPAIDLITDIIIERL